MRLHKLSRLLERDGQSVFFTQKQKKKKRKIKITKRGKNVMNIAQFFIALHCCIQNLHLLHFRAKFACPCIPKLMSPIRLWVHRFFIIYQLPKSNCMIHRTQRPLFFFIRLNVLCFMFQKTTVSFAFTLSKTTMSFALWFQRLQCL